MVIPLGTAGGANLPDEGATPEVKERFSVWWWLLMVVYIAVCIGRFVALDPFGGLLSLIMGGIAYYMVSNDCAKMSQYCVLLFGFMCMTNGILEFVTLATSLGGRQTSRTQSVPVETSSGARSSTSYSVTIEQHPFFDDQAGWVYNHQSAMMIVGPIAALLGAALAYFSYNAFHTSLFADDDAGGGGAQNWGGGQALGGAAAGGGLGYGGAAAPRRNQPAYTTFGGTGQRLGG